MNVAVLIRIIQSGRTTRVLFAKLGREGNFWKISPEKSDPSMRPDSFGTARGVKCLGRRQASYLHRLGALGSVRFNISRRTVVGRRSNRERPMVILTPVSKASFKWYQS